MALRTALPVPPPTRTSLLQHQAGLIYSAELRHLGAMDKQGGKRRQQEPPGYLPTRVVVYLRRQERRRTRRSQATGGLCPALSGGIGTGEEARGADRALGPSVASQPPTRIGERVG